MSTKPGRLKDVEEYVKGQIEAHRWLADMHADGGNAEGAIWETTIVKVLEQVLREIQR